MSSQRLVLRGSEELDLSTEQFGPRHRLGDHAEPAMAIHPGHDLDLGASAEERTGGHIRLPQLHRGASFPPAAGQGHRRGKRRVFRPLYQSSWAWPPQCEGQWLLGLVMDLPASCGPASSKGLRPGKLYARPARRPPGRVVFWDIFAGTVLLCHCWCHEVFGCAGAPGQGRWPEDHYVTRVRVIAPDQQSLVPHLDEPNITHRLETHAQK